ncbi:MAG: hypothetical protein HYT63_02215 [Candidatus Yanofskybacteria bacterium]|nr:hypothetical protein [Candidatus Yanofskybacteria bacterium]
MNYKILSAILGLMVVVLLWSMTIPLKKGGENRRDLQTNQQIRDDLLKSFPKEALIDPEATEGPAAVMTTSQGDSLVRIFSSKLSAEQLAGAVDAAMKNAGWLVEYKSANTVSYTNSRSLVSFSFAKKSEGAALLIEYGLRIAPVVTQ